MLKKACMLLPIHRKVVCIILMCCLVSFYHLLLGLEDTRISYIFSEYFEFFPQVFSHLFVYLKKSSQIHLASIYFLHFNIDLALNTILFILRLGYGNWWKPKERKETWHQLPHSKLDWVQQSCSLHSSFCQINENAEIADMGGIDSCRKE